jgi:hypothetical protein
LIKAVLTKKTTTAIAEPGPELFLRARLVIKYKNSYNRNTLNNGWAILKIMAGKITENDTRIALI